MELIYLQIEAYADKKFSSKKGTFKARINPETYTRNLSVSYSRRQAQGTASTSVKYDKSPPQELSFDLVFDATGVIKKSPPNLKAELQQFQDLVYTYKGGIHKPSYLKLIWGDALNFQCVLTNMSITYKLFRPDGSPIRADVKVTFTNFEDPDSISKKEKRQSPDMSHLVTIVAGDTLPALSYRIYGSTQYYLQVAKFNQLDNFRDLKPGTTVTFPPLV